MKKIIVSLIMGFSLLIPSSAFAATKDITDSLDRCDFYTTFKEYFETNYTDISWDSFIRGLDKIDGDNLIVYCYDGYTILDNSPTEGSLVNRYLFDNVKEEFKLDLMLQPQNLESRLTNVDTAVYRVGTRSGVAINRTAQKPEHSSQFKLNYILEPSLSMELVNKEDTINSGTDKKHFDINPLFTANIPYKVVVSHDGKVDGTELPVSYVFTDANSSSVTGGTLNYEETVSNTIIKATPTITGTLPVGEFNDKLNLTVSVQ